MDMVPGPGPGPGSSKRPAPAPIVTSAARIKREEGGGDDGNGQVQTSTTGRRAVCDHCRRRRIRCDGRFPCQQCDNAALACKREHVPKKRGPKRGHGRVINELRARENKGVREVESASASDIDTDYYNSAPTSAAATAPPSPIAQPFIPWVAVTSDPRIAPESKSAFTSDVYQPRSRNYLHLIPQCADLYHEHIYPIMPLLYMPTIREAIARPMCESEKNVIYAMSALTAFHMSGKSLALPGQPSWDEVGRFFLDECISVRQRYDFPEDTSLYAVISSFWLSTSFFEINQSRKSWYYLREALTLAIDIRLHDDASSVGLPPEEALCRQRVFWILFVTERSFAIFRNKPLTLRKTPSLPTTKHDYEPPDIHAGFLKLVSAYAPLDESFVAAWNDGSDPRVSATTYLNLQQILAQTLDFLRPKRKSPTPPGLPSTSTPPIEEGDDDPDPTAIQKADLMITQQWLRLIVWQSSFRQGLLSTAAADESFGFSFPLSIARDTAAILHSLPSRAVEVHGMGIFEKIFEIGTWSVNVMGAYDSGSSNPTRPFGGAMDGVGGMDFVGGELALFQPSGRRGSVLDPLEFFVKVLSASPNSKTMFADKLLLFAQQTPSAMRTSLSPALSTMGSLTQGCWNNTSRRGVLQEVNDEAGTGDFLANMEMHTDQIMSDDLGISISNTLAPGLGIGDGASNDDLELSVITTKSSGYSMPQGPTSAGLSTAFSDLSTSGDEYGLGAEFGNNLGEVGFGLIRNDSMNSMTDITSRWDQFPEEERKALSRTNSGISERVMGVW